MLCHLYLFNDATLADEWLNSKDLLITSHLDFVDSIWHAAIDVNYFSRADVCCDPGSKLWRSKPSVWVEKPINFWGMEFYALCFPNFGSRLGLNPQCSAHLYYFLKRQVATFYSSSRDEDMYQIIVRFILIGLNTLKGLWSTADFINRTSHSS